MKPQHSLHPPGPKTHFLNQPLKCDLKYQLECAGHWPGRPVLTAHYHGREGSFSPPSLLPPPAPSSLLAPFLHSQTELGLISAHTTHRQASQLLQEPITAARGKVQKLPPAMPPLMLVLLGVLMAAPPASCQGSIEIGLQG